MATHGKGHLQDCEALFRMPSTLAVRKPTTPLQLLSASGQLYYVAMAILGELPKTLDGNHFALVITDRFTKLAKPVEKCEMTAFNIVDLFVDKWEIPYGSPSRLRMDSKTQFINIVILIAMRLLGTKQLITTANSPQMDV